MPFLEARGISKSFPGVRALQNVRIHIERGETLAVCGENGAGKSTLMKILGGVQTPDAGDILMEGRLFRSTPSKMPSGRGSFSSIRN
ncbi:MAG: ATP-binding cassette domain-containing protein [Gemmataceae bacterium]